MHAFQGTGIEAAGAVGWMPKEPEKEYKGEQPQLAQQLLSLPASQQPCGVGTGTYSYTDEENEAAAGSPGGATWQPQLEELQSEEEEGAAAAGCPSGAVGPAFCRAQPALRLERCQGTSGCSCTSRRG